ncbi:MAG TPA: hypothetical protein VMT34_17045 [Aggregatilineales bacterium]|nr:hypothetical protein [Aggregatilineales bacterium]
MEGHLHARIAKWKEAVHVLQVHRLPGSDAGFRADENTKEVDYGYCQTNRFYVFVLENSRPGDWLTDTEGYVHVDDGYPLTCHPDGWTIRTYDAAGGGGYFVTIDTSQATFAAANSPSPTPTPTSSAF